MLVGKEIKEHFQRRNTQLFSPVLPRTQQTIIYNLDTRHLKQSQILHFFFQLSSYYSQIILRALLLVHQL
jgi:hypothetical protein